MKFGGGGAERQNSAFGPEGKPSVSDGVKFSLKKVPARGGQADFVQRSEHRYLGLVIQKRPKKRLLKATGFYESILPKQD